MHTLSRRASRVMLACTHSPSVARLLSLRTDSYGTCSTGWRQAPARAPAAATAPACARGPHTHHARAGGRGALLQHARCRSMPEHDLDAALISHRGLSSLAGPSGASSSAGDAASAASTTSSSSSSSGASLAESGSSTSSDAEAAALSVEEVQAHKRAAVQQAFLNDSLGFGFSAGGLVFPYYVGLVSSLVQHGVLTRPNHLAGSSAGSLIAASFNAGLDMATVEQSLIAFGEDCLKNGTRYRLGPLLRDFLENVLPPDAHEACAGVTHVAVTRLLPYWRTQMVSHFESRDDLIAALLTSCHIPMYFDGRWMTKFRGHYCVDGGVMAFVPTVPEVDYSVKVMCFPSSHLSTLKGVTANRKPLKRIHRLLDLDITMDTFEEWPYDLQQVLKWALLASAQETSSLLIEKGKRDAAAWVEAMDLAPLVAAKQQQQQQDGPSIILPGQAQGQQQQQWQPDSQVAAPSSSSSSSDGAPGSAAAASDWTDDKAGQQRQHEAAAAHVKAVAAEQDDGSRTDGRAAKHAAELEAAGAAEPPNKRHKAAAVAATVAAAAGEVADRAGSLLRGEAGRGGDGEQESDHQQR